MANKTLVVSLDQMPDWLEKRAKIMGEIEKQLIRGLCELGRGLTLDHLQATVEHRNPFEGVVDVSVFLADYQFFYKTCFGWELDFSNVRIPERRPGFDRLIVVAKGLTLNLVYEVCDEHFFKCWRYYDNLDAAVTHNDREPTEHYAVWVRDREEADSEHRNKSANEVWKQGIKGITLLERMILGLKYWIETNKYLDTDNITLCTGSRCQGGPVPHVDWRRHGGQVRVGCCRPDYSSDGLRAREVVSF